MSGKLCPGRSEDTLETGISMRGCSGGVKGALESMGWLEAWDMVYVCPSEHEFTD